MINAATRRSILRWIHIIVSVPICGYCYGPPDEVQQYAPAVRFIFVRRSSSRASGCGKVPRCGDSLPESGPDVLRGLALLRDHLGKSTQFLRLDDVRQVDREFLTRAHRQRGRLRGNSAFLADCRYRMNNAEQKVARFAEACVPLIVSLALGIENENRGTRRTRKAGNINQQFGLSAEIDFRMTSCNTSTADRQVLRFVPNIGRIADHEDVLDGV